VIDKDRLMLAISTVEKKYLDSEADIDSGNADPDSQADFIDFVAEMKYLKSDMLRIDMSDEKILKLKVKYGDLMSKSDTEILKEVERVDGIMQKKDP